MKINYEINLFSDEPQFHYFNYPSPLDEYNSFDQDYIMDLNHESIQGYDQHPPISQNNFQLEEKIDAQAKKENKENIQSNLKCIEIKSTAVTENIDKKNKKILFKTFKHLPRGKQTQFNPNKKIHSWDSFDLVRRKLQVHYQNYLISLGNDAIVAFNNFIKNKNSKLEINFLNILYDEKKKMLNHNKIKKLIYKEIFNFPISKKNRGYKKTKNTNKEKLKIICDKSSLLKDFFDQSYLEIFMKYYYKNERVINYKGLEISLSEKTETFDDLLKKGLNRMIEKKFLIIIDKFYFKIDKEEYFG